MLSNKILIKMININIVLFKLLKTKHTLIIIPASEPTIKFRYQNTCVNLLNVFQVCNIKIANFILF